MRKKKKLAATSITNDEFNYSNTPVWQHKEGNELVDAELSRRVFQLMQMLELWALDSHPGQLRPHCS